MNDITAIFLTQNEVPEQWAAYHLNVLLDSLQGAPMVVMSRKPMEGLGINLIQDAPKSLSNIYRQLLRGCKAATTEYIAVVEDDTLYPMEHFQMRPPLDKIGYNMNHWSLFTWGTPMYSWRDRRGNYSMLSCRELVIECLEERFAKYPNGTPDNITGELGRPMVEHNMGVKERPVHEFETTIGLVNFNHPFASDVLQLQQRKNPGKLHAFDIPQWGRAEDLVANFK